ncbi:unnamed protein product [Acidithrix sp. C25]|nr:unnamed protein product [Acidithrix sp. C25]
MEADSKYLIRHFGSRQYQVLLHFGLGSLLLDNDDNGDDMPWSAPK